MKKELLLTILRRQKRTAIAYSGGVDSTLLARAAQEAVGAENVLLLLADSVLLPRCEFNTAVEWAKTAQLPYCAVPFTPLEAPEVAENSPQRCYHCKKLLMGKLRETAIAAGFPTLNDGANCDDLSDYRPGMRACDELGVVHPLLEAGLTKTDIREMARTYGIAHWEAPAAACLASRIATGTPLEAAALTQVEQAEELLHTLGFRGARARRIGTQIKVELRAESDWLLLAGVRGRLAEQLHALGATGVTVDLDGYRRGAMNEPGSAAPEDATPANGH